MHKTTLQIIEELNDSGPQSAAVLQQRYELSVATLKRHISTARLLGCQIVSVRHGSVWKFELRNGPAVMTLCRKWLEIEKNRTLLE